LGAFLHWALLAYLRHGDRRNVDALIRDIGALAELTHDVALEWRPRVLKIMEHTLDGKLDQALQSGDELIQWSAQAGMDVLGRTHAAAWTLRVRWYLGKFEAAEADTFVDEVALGPLRVERGERQQAQDVLERSRQRQVSPELSEPSLYRAVPCLETATALQDFEYASELGDQLRTCTDLIADYYSFASVGRLLGKAAILAGDTDLARSRPWHNPEWCSVDASWKSRRYSARVSPTVPSLTPWSSARGPLRST